MSIEDQRAILQALGLLDADEPTDSELEQIEADGPVNFDGARGNPHRPRPTR